MPTKADKKKDVANKKEAPKKEVAIKKEAVAKDDENNESGEKSKLETLIEAFAVLEKMVKEFKPLLKDVQKEYAKNQKVINKEKARREKAKRSPSGFAKPTKISNEMCDFMKIPHGTEKSRTDVTRCINGYIKTKNLNNPTNKKIIIPDSALKKLLRLNNGEEFSYFQMQKFLTPHIHSAKNAVKA